MSDKRILIAEDSSTQAQALASLLEQAGYYVQVAPDGEKALEAIEREHFDLVLTDIMMPRIGGWELCRRIKFELGRPDLPVVLLTSLTDPHDIIRGLECGADNYITKPYEPQQLLARVRNVFDSRSLRRTPRSSLGMEITFLGTKFSINSEKEQILDLFLSSVEDVVNTKNALEISQRDLSTAHAELASAHARLAQYARDIERRERLSTGKYRSLMQNATDGILVLDLDGSILEANHRAGQLLAARADALPGRMLAEYFTPDQASEFRRQFTGLREMAHVEMRDVRIENPSGATTYCELHASCAQDDDDYLVLVILQDITERKKAEAALRDSNEMLQTLIEASPLAIIAVDPYGHVMLWNESAQRIFGWTREQTVGQPPPFVPADRVQEFKALGRRVMSGERLAGTEVVRRTATGEQIELNMWAAPLRDSTGSYRGAVAIMADVSERKALELQLRQAQKMEAIGTLAGGVAHDFNNVLTAITGYADVLLSECDTPELRRDLEEIRKAAARATGLTRQLLAFSRKQMLQPRVLNLNAIVSDMAPMLARLIPENIVVRTKLAANLGNVFVDPVQMEQVLLNLVVNARDATAATGGTVRIQTRNVTLSAHDTERFPFHVAPGEYVVLEVIDDGHGMDAETRQHIFEPFFTTKSKDKGTGLGLSTVYGIVKQSGGHLDVVSAPGEGATITVYLPRNEMSETVAPAEEPERDHTTFTNDETILLVEDESAVRRLVTRVLRKAGYQVLEAESGPQAIRIAEQNGGEIALLLTDVVMPEMGGPELSEQLLATYPQLRVLYMSGYTEQAMNSGGQLRPGTSFLEKPFVSATLLQKVREALEGSRI